MSLGRRLPRLNAMEGVEEFLRAWRSPDDPENREPAQIHRTGAGNLNSTGRAGDYRGPALSRWHPQFDASLEPGIADLVKVLALGRGWITYTSCEGHAYPGADVAPVERHVGILPRDDAERAHVRSVLGAASVAARRRARSLAVAPTVVDGTLWSGPRPYPVVDLFFHRRPWASWGAYFRALPPVYDAVVGELRDA